MAGLRAVTVLSFALLARCASSYHDAADREGTAIQSEMLGGVERFRSSELVDPRRDAPPPRTARPAPGEVPELLRLPDAIRIATRHSRDYQSQREGFFLTCLNLGLVRRDFGAFVFDGTLSHTAVESRHDPMTNVTALALSGTRVLPWGGTVTVSTDASLGTSVAGDATDQSATAGGSVTVAQPLLRGAGHEVAFEALTQSERDAVYAARDFELFRQRFAIDIVQQFYGLVSQKRGLANLRKNVDAQDFSRRQSEALFRLGRGTKVDVFRAEQSWLGARTNLVSSEQAYALALDRFKIVLGLPTDIRFDVDDTEIPALTPFEVDLERAVAAALVNRLDLKSSRERVEDAERGVRIARNALLPGLDLTATYRIANDPRNSFSDLSFRDDTATLGVVLELPLDRKAARNAYRSSTLSLDQARRSHQRAEDDVILAIRDSLRQLAQQRLQIGIENQNIESLRKSVRKAEIDYYNGNASNRDVVEALDSLTGALNAQNDRHVAYEVARLNLLQQMGLLFIDREGGIVP